MAEQSQDVQEESAPIDEFEQALIDCVSRLEKFLISAVIVVVAYLEFRRPSQPPST